MALIQWGRSPFDPIERVLLRAMRRPASLDELDIPSVDMTEDKENFYIISELPGMSEDDVKVTVDADLLTISGNKERKKDTKVLRYHRAERNYGEFVRCFTIPANVNANAITGTFRNGLLELTLPKTTVNIPAPREIMLNKAQAMPTAPMQRIAEPIGQLKSEKKAVLA